MAHAAQPSFLMMFTEIEIYETPPIQIGPIRISKILTRERAKSGITSFYAECFKPL
jgi:hypothetical protein